MTAADPSEPIALPAPPAPPRRGAIPVVAAFVPMIGAVVMWLVTGYILMLCFAALGPGDSPELHLADTLAAGVGLVDREAAEQLVREGAEAMQRLLAAGFAADRDA